MLPVLFSLMLAVSDITRVNIPISYSPIVDKTVCNIPLGDLALSNFPLGDLALSNFPLVDLPLINIPLVDIDVSNIQFVKIAVSNILQVIMMSGNSMMYIDGRERGGTLKKSAYVKQARNMPQTQSKIE